MATVQVDGVLIDNAAGVVVAVPTGSIELGEFATQVALPPEESVGRNATISVGIAMIVGVVRRLSGGRAGVAKVILDEARRVIVTTADLAKPHRR